MTGISQNKLTKKQIRKKEKEKKKRRKRINSRIDNAITACALLMAIAIGAMEVIDTMRKRGKI